MRTRTLIFTGATLAVAVGALALVRPPEGQTLPEYDVRSTMKGLALGTRPSNFRTLGGGRTIAPSAEKQEAVARLSAAAGGEVQVRWQPLNEAPKVLFRHDGPLTGPDRRDPALIARTFLQDYADLFGLTPTGIQAFSETRRFATKGGTLTVLHLEQFAAGLNVYNGDIRFHITPAGEIASVSATHIIASTANLNATPSFDAGEALRAAARGIGMSDAFTPVRLNPLTERIGIFERGGFRDAPRVEAVLFPMGASARIAYKVLVGPATTPDVYELVVDGTDGSLLFRYNTTKYVQTHGLVFREHPLAGPGPANVPTDEPFWDDSFLFDPRWPLGWATPGQIYSIGNVIDSKEDWAGDDEATIGQRSSDFQAGPPIFFEDPWRNIYETGGNATSDGLFAITNLFYLANAYHDWLYAWGFDEPAGVWQQDNFGRGGKDGDRLLGDAQDSYNAGQRNNANMQTAQDGLSPRAQFYAFTAPPFARRDSTVDGDIVIHEFTHGLSHRLVAGANSASCLFSFQSGAMGEGWSDYYALEYYDDDVMGEYGTGNVSSGIRGARYGAYPACHNYNRTANFCGQNACGGVINTASYCEVHDEGELWAATLWEMRTIIGDPDVALRLVTDGLKLTACQPSMLDARDAILLADRYDYAGAHQCQIWEAFADRFMGWSASVTSGDDIDPLGANDLPPFCQNNGTVLVDLDRYGCAGNLIATVHDANAATPVTVRITTTAGDSETVNLSGVAPTFQTAPLTITSNPATPGNGQIEVVDGGSITAEYNDTSGSGLVNTQAAVVCKARVEPLVDAAGGCQPDGTAWPVTLPQILDPGEIVTYNVVVYNREPRDLTNAQLTITAISDAMVMALTPSPIALGDIPAFTGTATGTFDLAASRFLAPGQITVDLDFTADGFTGAETPIQLVLPVASNYQVVTGQSLGIDAFEGNDGGYTHFPWPNSLVDEWQYNICGAASGTGAWHAGPASCSGNSAEQDAVLQSRVFNPTTSQRISWYPTELKFNERINVNTSEVVIWFVEPNFWSGGDYIFANDYGGSSGGVYRPQSFPLTAADSLGAGIENERGLQIWFDFFTAGSAAPSGAWSLDDVELRYDAADAVSDLASPTCIEAGYYGTLSGCAGIRTLSVYNTVRPANMQYLASGGRFWEVNNDWNLFDIEFTPATAPGETLVMLVNANPDGGTHAGSMAVDGRLVTSTTGMAFARPAVCAPIPVPIGPASTIASGQTIPISWTPFVESGTTPAIVGYNVYRLDAEAFPQATSTIDDYLAGTLVGTTVGQPDINRFVDGAPPLVSPPVDLYSYAIQPLLRCDGPGCTGPVPATFGGDESTPGKANLSGDNMLSNGGPPIGGPVRVSAPLLATFHDFRADRQGSSVRVRWVTSAEIDTLGFDVYRGTTSDEAAMEKIASVEARGRHGASYEVSDVAAPSGPVYYQVREVSLNLPSRTPVFAVTVAGGGSGRSGSGRSRTSATSGGGSSGIKAREGRVR